MASMILYTKESQMPRQARYDSAGCWHHVMNCGTDHGTVFRADADFQLFVQLLTATAKRFELSVHTYCLMRNHYHLLVESGSGRLSPAMQYLSGIFTQMINYRDGRDGPLFRGRFASVAIAGDAQLLNACRYIHLNPVTAGLVTKTEDWFWSSARAYVDRKSRPDWLTTSFILDHFDTEPSFNTYEAFIASGTDEETWRAYEVLSGWGQTRRV